MMDFHVITPIEEQLVMRTTEGGCVVLVLPAPTSSLPRAAVPAQPELDK